MHCEQCAETAEQARQLAVVQAQVVPVRVSPVGQEVHVVSDPEQVGQLISHGKHEPPLR